MTCISIARQRLGKHIAAGANALNGRTPFARQRISKHASLIIEALFSAWSVQSGYKEVFSSIKWSEELSLGTQPAGIWVWNWIESDLRNWQLRNNCRKGIRRCKGDFMLDLKWQWDCDKSVARIRLVKTEKCVTVNCKVCRSEIALYCL
jgi:hypothetical protein